MNGNASQIHNNAAEELKPMGAMGHLRDSSLSINSLEKAVDALAESLADALACDVRSIGSAGKDEAHPSTGSAICDVIFSNDARVRALTARVDNLNSRLRV